MDHLLEYLNDAPEHDLIREACVLLIARLGQKHNPAQHLADWTCYASDAQQVIMSLGGIHASDMVMRLADELLAIPAAEGE